MKTSVKVVGLQFDEPETSRIQGGALTTQLQHSVNRSCTSICFTVVTYDNCLLFSI
jgi:hypothetical protein